MIVFIKKFDLNSNLLSLLAALFFILAKQNPIFTCFYKTCFLIFTGIFIAFSVTVSLLLHCTSSFTVKNYASTNYKTRIFNTGRYLQQKRQIPCILSSSVCVLFCVCLCLCLSSLFYSTLPGYPFVLCNRV